MLKVAIFSRPGGCFPNIISLGLASMLDDLNIQNEIFYDSIPFLMRLLPLSEKPMHWKNNFHYRLSNKIKNYRHDKKFLRKLADFDLIIISECLPNALWKNYLAVEELRRKTKIKIGCYTDGSITIAPKHKEMLLKDCDYGDDRYDFNLFASGIIEKKFQEKNSNKAIIGIRINATELFPCKKDEFTAVVDFPQKGYETFRDQQLSILNDLGIKTIALEGKYALEEIRGLYRKASAFFLSFPETFGLPIAECLATGAYIFTPDSAWPMAWRLEQQPQSWASGNLPACFKVYKNGMELANQLRALRDGYDLVQTPKSVFNIFVNNYRSFYYGDIDALGKMMAKFG